STGREGSDTLNPRTPGRRNASCRAQPRAQAPRLGFRGTFVSSLVTCCLASCTPSHVFARQPLPTVIGIRRRVRPILPPGKPAGQGCCLKKNDVGMEAPLRPALRVPPNGQVPLP